MLGGKKKPQLRRCANCGKVGHNRSRCPDLSLAHTEETPNTATSIQPVRFFIHHVNHENYRSPHVVDLRQHTTSLWENAQAIKPDDSKHPHYHFYHENKTVAVPVPPPPMAALATQEIKEPPTPSINLWKSAKENLKEKKENLFDNLSEVKTNLIAWCKNTFFTKRIVATGIILAILSIIPTQARSYYQNLKLTTDKISNSSTAGFVALQDSTNALLASQIPSAQTSLVNALEDFDAAVSEMKNNHQILQKIASVIPILGTEVASRQKLITAGQKIALGNTYILKGLSDTAADPNLNLTDRLAVIFAHLKASLPNYAGALEDFDKVEIDSLPFEYQKSFADFKILFTSLVGDFKSLSALGTSLQEIFGGQGERRYLLVFQNPDEIRPTGGFIGSFAIMDVKDGQIIKMEVPAGGSYDLQGQLNQFVEPPAPLLLANKRWEFQDANWFPDFPASASKMLWFYQHSRNTTADGVIALNATVLQRLLALMGPMIDQKRNITLTADNAIPTLQKVVEEGPEKQNHKPKQILADLAPQFINYFKNIKSTDAMPILINLEEALQQKEIQAYFTDTATEETVKSLGWGGQVLSTGENQDYLMVVNTNIQGEKSDAEIKQTISHQAVIQDDGSIIDTVLIKREHTGVAGEKLYGRINIDYLRIYVPEGSKLISASGFTWPNEASFKAPENFYKKDETLKSLEKEVMLDEESGTRITNEFGKTAFGNWVITTPGQISQVQFSYRLPFKVTEIKNSSPSNDWKNMFISTEDKIVRYQLVAQKQSGIDSIFDSQIIFPDNWTPAWHDGRNMQLATNGAAISSTTINKDTVWSLIMKNNKLNTNL